MTVLGFRRFLIYCLKIWLFFLQHVSLKITSKKESFYGNNLRNVAGKRRDLYPNLF